MYLYSFWAKMLIASLYFSLVISKANAADISLMIIETGLNNDEKKVDYSISLENMFFALFFDEGHIVSNLPILRVPEKPEHDILLYVSGQLRQESLMDFFIILQLDYKPESSAGLQSSLPYQTAIFIYQTNPYKKIFEKNIAGKKYANAKEENDGLKTIVTGILLQFKGK